METRRPTRREALRAWGGAAAAIAAGAGGLRARPGEEARPPAGDGDRRPTAISLNEDDSHYYFSRAGQALDEKTVASWVDSYAGTQVRELMLCPNAMRTSYGSAVWDPIWRGYDPDGPDDQPLLASTAPADRKAVRGWIHTAWKLHRDGIDPYAVWIRRCREKGIFPWISMRMNDVHNADDERSFIHSEFWRQNPAFRRVPERFSEWVDRAFDYGRPEVREHHMKLIRELVERYDMDGLELDWMRFGFHFRPGKEAEGAAILTEFTAEVRGLLDRKGKDRGRRILLGARVPSRPATALGLGMDAGTWARRGLVDRIVVTPFWAAIEPDMPIEAWREVLGPKVLLAAGLEILLRPYPAARAAGNSLETVRGAAASLLARGADRIYLFNYMDGPTDMPDPGNYPVLLREAGSLETLAGKPRRHVVTYSDTWAPGEHRTYVLPAESGPGRPAAFALHAGERPPSGTAEVRLGLEGDGAKEAVWDVRLNGRPCAPAGEVPPGVAPRPPGAFIAFRAPSEALVSGSNRIEAAAPAATRLVWAEIAVGP